VNYFAGSIRVLFCESTFEAFLVKRNQKIMYIRPRRNRRSASVRQMVRETELSVRDFIFPLFLVQGENRLEAVPSMPGMYRRSLDLLRKEVEECLELGLTAFDIFPSVDESLKDEVASYSYQEDNFYLHTLRELKREFPEATLMTDVAMDPYSSAGHDGIYHNGEILNDETLEVLGKMALAQAEAGADIIGPSDMMDGRVAHIRETLDEAGFSGVSIMSYTAKYASAFYGPFRDALDSAPKFGDKKTYQMDPANRREALLEAELDAAEGADILMVKPALAYLDVIRDLSEHSLRPIAAYNVSGEYSMIMAAAEKGWLDEWPAMTESILSIKRAGASVILSYYAKKFAERVKGEGLL